MRALKRLGVMVTVLLIFQAAGVRAGYGPDGAGNLGAGLMLGSPTGATFKYWLDRKTAVDTGIGWGVDGGLTLVADYLWHDFSAFSFQNNPSLDKQLAFYIGPGVRIRIDDDHVFGLRGVMGASYLFPKNPFELYAEIVPVLVLVDHPTGSLDGGIGFRYYFR